MANQNVIDAINATIVENGQKGITADSLRNLLLMMAENGGGASAHTIVVKSAELGTSDLTAEEKANNAAIYAICEECYNNRTPLPIIMCDLSGLSEVMVGARVSYLTAAASIIFTPTEIEGLIGLAITPAEFDPLLISADGSLTLMPME